LGVILGPDGQERQSLKRQMGTSQKTELFYSVYGGLLPFSHKKASYLNGIGVIEDATTNAFQENYARLVEIKKKYDPENLFHHTIILFH